MIHLKNLAYHYSGGTFLNFPTIQLESQESLVVLGESGSGKSTLLQLIALLLSPTTGKMVIDHIDVTQLSEREKDRFRRNHIGIIFQKAVFIQSLTVFENLQAKLLFSKTKLSDQHLDELLSDLNILPIKTKKVNALSEGQKQRLSIALALVNKPSLILADEPTASLDDANKKRVIDLLKKVSKKNKASLILVTHDTRIVSEFQNQITL